MTILFISHKYPPAMGGMEKFSYELIHYFESRPDVKVLKYIYKEGANKIYWFATLKRAIRKILKENPEIAAIHVNDGLMAYFTQWLKPVTSVPIIATIHGLDITFPLGIYQKKIIPTLSKKFDQFICVSQATKSASIERGIAAAKITVVKNGVDHTLSKNQYSEEEINKVFQKFGIEHTNKKVLVGLGRGVKRKGYGWFVTEVLPELPSDYVFVMLGPESNYKKIQKWLNVIFSSKVRENVELILGLSTDDKTLSDNKSNPKLAHRYFRTGRLSFDEVNAMLQGADLFIMPNISIKGDMEGFGLVALEASLHGKFVLASEIDGITSAVVNRGNGRLIPSQNKTAWMENILDLFENNNLKTLGIQGREYTLTNYSWEKMGQEYYDAFHKLIKNNK